MNMLLKCDIEHNEKIISRAIILDYNKIDICDLITMFAPISCIKDKNDSNMELIKIKSLILASLRSVPLIKEGKL